MVDAVEPLALVLELRLQVLAGGGGADRRGEQRSWPRPRGRACAVGRGRMPSTKGDGRRPPGRRVGARLQSELPSPASMRAMSEPRRRREIARGERVLPGVWRLRLPLPWPGVPHCNAWAIASDGGIVLFDTGMATDDGLRQLELALAQVGLRARRRAAGRLHARPRRPLRARGPDRRRRRLRALDPPGVGARAADGRGPRRAPSTAGSRSRARAGSRRRRSSSTRQRRGHRHRHRPPGRARPRAGPRGRGRDRPRRLGGARDARSRAVARRPAPARERAC